jgi:hypothetical protein
MTSRDILHVNNCSNRSGKCYGFIKLAERNVYVAVLEISFETVDLSEEIL